MATALYNKRVIDRATTILEDKRRAAQEAAEEFFIAKDINGIKLCWMGRVVRAMDKAKDVPAEKQQDYRALVNGIVEQAEAAHKRQRDTWLAYVETAKFAAEKPIPLDISACQCEGCKMVEENNQRMANLHQ